MDVPPSRYRVVEQGRRLVVVDTRTGEPASSPVPRPTGPARGDVRMAANAAAAAGKPTFVTSPLFDNKAPRTIVIDDNNSRRMGSAVGLVLVVVILLASLAWLMPALLVVFVVVLANHAIRRGLRAAFTKWLDGVVQDTGASRG